MVTIAFPLVHRKGFALTAATATLAVIATMLWPAQQAFADTDPPAGTPATVTADALPTVQMNGIAWDQEVVGDVVYAAGSFSSARPAGAAPGTDETPRSNLLAYSLSTGQLIASFAPTINAQVRQVAAAPDGKTLYIVGDFSTVNGVSRNRVAAFDLPSGTLTSFNPNANSTVDGVDATNTAVYLTGTFGRVSGQDRAGAAAFTRSGSLLPWAPDVQRRGRAVIVSPDETKVVIGGDFPTLNGSANPGYGLGMVDAQSGASLPFGANSVIRNAGNNAAILSLKSDEDSVYGVGYTFGSGGTLEGSFRASWDTGNLEWVNDCHGDQYDVQPMGDTVYAAGHPHYCGSLEGGFPQSDPNWTFYRAIAVTKTVNRNVPPGLNLGYNDFVGNPQPKLQHWFPLFNTGTVSGAYQGPWTVNGNSEYLVYGGEFTRVNNVGQQGLVRFAIPSKAPEAQGPILWNTDWMPSATQVANGAVRVSWPSNWDRDNEFLKYEVLRDNVVIKTFDALRSKKDDWAIPPFGYVDTTVEAGTNYSYRVRATDARGNSIMSGTATASASGASTPSAYKTAVLKDLPSSYWPLDEATGATASDWGGGSDLTLSGGYTRNLAGAISGESDRRATRFGGSSGFGATDKKIIAPQTFSIEAWVRTDANNGPGGKIAGFGNNRTGLSSSYDRHIYMESNGRISFGVNAGGQRTITSPSSYNDAQWHHVVATLGTGGMVLYVDGARVAQRTDAASAAYYYGYWRVGGDRTWAGNSYFRGDIDEVAVYTTPLSLQSVEAHYAAAGRTVPASTRPTDAYGAAVYDLAPTLYWRMDETTGSIANDTAGMGQRGRYLGGHTKNVAGPLQGVANPGVRFSGGQIVSENSFSDPRAYSLEAWFNTTSTNGGKILGFGSSSSTSNSTSYDRHVYMTNTGQLVFGTYSGVEQRLTTPQSYNDGGWHQVVATQDASGMRLYVDGQLIDSNTAAQAQSYSGYWHVGGDVTWGPGGNQFGGTIDEVAVYSAALPAADVALHYGLGTTGTAPNVKPTASFVPTTNRLNVSVDGTASSDPDGTIAEYRWDWGDGAPTSTGATSTHTYAAAGAYTITLTVTDNDGATSSKTAQVSVAPNQAPTASFTTTTAELTVSVNGSDSADPDGTIASYSWDWGDGSPAGSGATATHSYATPGDYTLKLTVTDNEGATGVTSHPVSVSLPVGAVTYARDSFGRNVATGLGAADVGGSWSLLQSAGNYRVDGDQAVFVQPAGGSQRYAYLQSVSSTDTAVEVDVTLPQRPVGGSSFSTVHLRRISGDEYVARLIVTTGGGVTAQLMRNGTVLTNVGTSVNLAAGDTIRVRGEATGASPTTLNLKVWKVGSPEPATWTTTTTDATAALQAPGQVGLGVYLGGGATNTPFQTRFDNFWAGSTEGAPEPPANQAPTAAFTATAADLSVHTDGSGSSDPDGTIASYAWDWGDNSPAGSGAAATHTYTAAGTYVVKLTVTDNQGATATLSKNVTVTAPGGPANQAPAAAFTATAADLTASVDASASTDPDGTITSYGWDWGDGSAAGTGVTTTHAYAAAGTYTVTLTVTDDQGATATHTEAVTVAAPPQPDPVVFGADDFDRAPGLLGSAAAGGAWTQTAGVANVGVEDNAARLTSIAASQTRTASLPAAVSDSTDLTVSFRVAALPSSSGRLYISTLGRVVGAADYRARWIVDQGGGVQAQVANGGSVIAWRDLTGLTLTPGTTYNARVQVFGTAPTSLRSKVWEAGTAEPADWQVSGTDASAELQAPGYVGFSTYTGGGFQTLPYSVFFDDFHVQTVAP
ncbi:PKD domain-containing protein [Leucobacter sp. HY1910]